MLARSLLTIAFGGCLLALLALPGAPAQSPTAPTASIDPEAIDAIWQKASSKYDGQRAALLKQVDAADHHGPFRPDWESLQKYEAPEWSRMRSSASLSIGASIRCQPSEMSGIPSNYRKRSGYS
jgi:alpha-L-fucosidase